MRENEQLISFMNKHNLSAEEVGKLLGRKKATVFAWRSNRTPPSWVLPILKTKVES
jgi:DNA-binding XRE family transcriptional regulator